jgi:hypothetical protein
MNNLHRAGHILTVAIVLTAGSAWAAFTPPTASQLKETAKEPARIAALVQEASVQQAAEVARDVIVLITRLDLAPKTRDARIGLLINKLFAAMPGQTFVLAATLGRLVAAHPTTSLNPAIVSAIQQAVVTAAGSSGSEAGASFGNAYQLALQTVAGAPNGSQTIPPPPPPPVGLPYEGQSLP